MPRLKVEELAKKLNMPPEEVLQELQELGLEVKTISSYIDEETVSLILEIFKEEEQSADKIKSPKSKKVKDEKDVEEEESFKEEILLKPEDLTLKAFAARIGVPLNKIIQDMFVKGIALNPNQRIDEKQAKEIAKTYGYRLRFEQEQSAGKEAEISESKLQALERYFEELYTVRKNELVIRPPVVTVMGHVDHGKTTLLDRIRKTRIAEQEVGGITQSIGAYQVEHAGKKITFIDTPGHELFTEMRAKGVQVTDIVVLVVAADDGVMPQTIEAYNHAKAANVPVIVAINKIDKPNANVEATKQQLITKLNLVPEDWGGDTIVVPISARTGQGIDQLLEMILLVAELKEIKCYPKGRARAVIIESKIDRALGPIANVIVKDGVLSVGDYVISGPVYCKVRALIDDKGRRIKSAEPSQPVMIVGFEELPDVKHTIYAVESLETAREIAQEIKEMLEKEKPSRKKINLEDLLKMMEESGKRELNIVIKADTTGSLNAVQNAVLSIKTTEEIKINVVHAGVGAINSGDVMLASASDGMIIGFRVKVDSQARKVAEAEGVEIKTYEIIYDLIDSLKLALEGMLKPEYVEELVGRGEIKQVFRIKKVGNVAGVQMLEGYVTNDSTVKVYRNGVLIFSDKISSLKHYKQDVARIDAPQQCGIKLQNREDFQEGDELEFYVTREIRRKIETTQSGKGDH